MTPRALLLETSARFRAAGIPDPETDSALLLSSICLRSPLELRLDTETDLDRKTQQTYDQLVSRRLSRFPLQYILGEASFCGHLFKVDSRALIPRPETELLCSWAAEELRCMTNARVLDLCCGSGCLGLSLKASLPGISVTLSDLSEDALALAAENAASLSLDVTFCQGDLLTPFADNAFDLIVCNPPYIPSALCPGLQPEVRFEPLMALDGGVDGLSFYRRLSKDAQRVLTPGGVLLMELGMDEASPVFEMLSCHGFCSLSLRPDDAGIPRMIRAVRPKGEKE